MTSTRTAEQGNIAALTDEPPRATTAPRRDCFALTAHSKSNLALPVHFWSFSLLALLFIAISLAQSLFLGLYSSLTRNYREFGPT